MIVGSAVCLSLSLSQSQRMQQPLAHLYFLTLLEHLQTQGHKLSALVRYANAITKQCASHATEEVESVLLWVELQAVVQVILQELAIYVDPSKLRMEEVHLLKDDINRLCGNKFYYNRVCTSHTKSMAIF